MYVLIKIRYPNTVTQLRCWQMRSQLEQRRLFLKPKSRFANIVRWVMKGVAASVLTVASEKFSQHYHYSPIRFVNKSTETPAACKEKQLKLKIILFHIQYPLPSQHHLVHQEVVLLVALHQAPNHMALRVVLPLPAVPQVVPGVHTAHREVYEALHQHLRTL